MRRFLKITLPIVIIAALFTLIYFLAIPKVELPSSAEINVALTLLGNYGFESQQITNNLNYSHLGLCFAGFVISCIAYFYYYDWSEKRKIQKVINYVRKINQRVYDLKSDENSEDDLSLLTNELYKTTVLLQEATENNQKRAKNMETALADISHQLRTPLTSLQIMLDNLHDNPDLDAETRQDFLLTAGRQVEQMSELVVTLLNLAKLSSGTLKMKPKIISASDLLNDAVNRLSVLAELNNISIKMSGDLDTKLKVDKKWQSEALSNIVKNCIEHSRTGQSVDITVQNTAVFTKITISDNGDGISAEDIRHIFERFYKAKNARDESVGIGLAFAKTVIEADGGQVRVKSKLGDGTRFIIDYYY